MWILLLFAIAPRLDRPAIDFVDTIERNFFYDEHGRLVFEQIIGWHKDHVRFWVLANREKRIELQEVRGRHVLWFDDGAIFREIWSLSFYESHTQWDPELADRDQLPKEKRQPLSSRKNPCQSIMPR